MKSLFSSVSVASDRDLGYSEAPCLLVAARGSSHGYSKVFFSLSIFDQ